MEGMCRSETKCDGIHSEDNLNSENVEELYGNGKSEGENVVGGKTDVVQQVHWALEKVTQRLQELKASVPNVEAEQAEDSPQLAFLEANTTEESDAEEKQDNWKHLRNLFFEGSAKTAIKERQAVEAERADAYESSSSSNEKDKETCEQDNEEFLGKEAAMEKFSNEEKVEAVDGVELTDTKKAATENYKDESQFREVELTNGGIGASQVVGTSEMEETILTKETTITISNVKLDTEEYVAELGLTTSAEFSGMTTEASKTNETEITQSKENEELPQWRRNLLKKIAIQCQTPITTSKKQEQINIEAKPETSKADRNTTAEQQILQMVPVVEPSTAISQQPTLITPLPLKSCVSGVATTVEPALPKSIQQDAAVEQHMIQSVINMEPPPRYHTINIYSDVELPVSVVRRRTAPAQHLSFLGRLIDRESLFCLVFTVVFFLSFYCLLSFFYGTLTSNNLALYSSPHSKTWHYSAGTWSGSEYNYASQYNAQLHRIGMML